ncbi:MAG: hypothetical protein V8Q86_03330 [Blautia sp.]
MFSRGINQEKDKLQTTRREISMSKKILLHLLVIGTLAMCSGCGKSTPSEESNVTTVQDDKNLEAEDSFPKSYNTESESGKVKFNCTLDLPEKINGRSIQKTSVEGLHVYDKDKAYSLFAEGKEVSQKDQYDWDGGDVANYTFSDGSSLYLDNYVQWGSATSSLYAYLGVQQSDYIDLFSAGAVSLDKDSCISEIEKDMNELGYDTENLTFQAIPLSVDAMKKLRDQELNNGLLEEGKTKEPTSDDEAYFIYAYQKNNGIPVFHELMSAAKQMADDSPDNAPVQAIYSARGLEELNIDYIYDFKNEQDMVTLKPFEEIASVVEEKYENLLNDSKYEITRAKLYERVYTGENQKYAEEPIWYFEIVENDNNKTVMLVNAETGKEINLP